MWLPPSGDVGSGRAVSEGNDEYTESVGCLCPALPRCVLRRTEEVGLEFEPELVRDHRYLFTNEKVTTVPSEREQGYETRVRFSQLAKTEARPAPMES